MALIPAWLGPNRLGLRMLSAFAVAIASFTPTLGRAQSLGFMPGDAYFIFLLNERLGDSLPDKGGTLELPYHMPLFALNGFFAGFERLRIDGVTPQFVQNLRRAYRDHRRYVPKIVREDGKGTEMNPPIAFVYDRSLDWSKARLCLKYNANWRHLPPEAVAGPDRNLLGKDSAAEYYVTLIKTYDGVVEDWAHAGEFKPLAVQVPKNIAWGKWGRPIKEPVVAHAKDVQIVVTTEEDLDSYFQPPPLPVGPSFYQVTPEGVNLCYWKSDDGHEKELIKEKLEEATRDTLLQSERRKRRPPTLYYGQARDNRKNGDITIPVWPDCRVPLGVPMGTEY